MRVAYRVCVFLTLVFVVGMIHAWLTDGPEVREVPYSDALDLIAHDEVASVEIKGDTLTLTPNREKYPADAKPWVNKTERTGEMKRLEDLLLDHHVRYEAKKPIDITTWLISAVVILSALAVFARVDSEAKSLGGLLSFLNHRGKRAEKVTVSFRDVAGYEQVKEQLGEVVQFLRDPKVFARLGAEMPRGTLLWGPPGTGKTHLARAVAGEAGVPFFYLSGSDFVEMYAGVGAGRVRSLFIEARKAAPCIIFIDEIDGVGKHRSDTGQGSDSERDQTLNALMTEIDGFDPTIGVEIIAATNRPESLDAALRRNGRFDRKIFVGPPSAVVREAILRVQMNGKIGEGIDYHHIARLTPGMVGADMKAIVNEAAMIATREQAEAIETRHFVQAIENVAVGHKDRGRRLSPEGRRIVAAHEAGHAVVQAALGRGKDVIRVSITPTSMGALGFNLNTPEEESDTELRSRGDLLAQVTHLLAGRAAEDVILQEVSTGARDDLKTANLVLYQLVTVYGLSERLFNRVIDLEGTFTSDATDEAIDTEIARLLEETYNQGKAIVVSNREVVDALMQHLLDEEELSGEPLAQLLAQVKPKDTAATS